MNEWHEMGGRAENYAKGEQMHYSRKQKGRAAEEAAALYLGAKGYAIVERNWRCRTGEIDIVAEKGGCLIFIEVRSRSGHLTQGTPEESVDAPKMDQVRRTAGVYLHINGQGERPVSFDVITVMLNRDLSIASLNHICDAF